MISNINSKFVANVVPALVPCPSTQNLRTVPDVPHAVEVYTIRCCTEGNGVGLFVQEPPVCPNLLGALNNINRDFNTTISSSKNEKIFFENFSSSSRKILGNDGGLNLVSFFNVKLNNDGEVPIDFVFDTGEGEIRWETTFMAGRRLLITVSSTSLSELTKESFVALLEMAEEKLGCREIYVEFPTTDESADRLRHTFFYLGFKPVPPSTSLPTEEGYVIM
uniref:Ornithine decarboxylase antizyme n=1 Tax=Romanomermis culicivorax TaxID=13658 RepID=A0A915IW38_ROMCU